MKTVYKYVIIVGYGRLGSNLANCLRKMGSNVLVIDGEETALDTVDLEFSGLKITGNAAELDVLRRAKIDKADCLLAITNQDNLNLMVAQIAKTMFNVPKVMAQVCDPDRAGVYRQFDIETIRPIQLSEEAFLSALWTSVEIKPW